MGNSGRSNFAKIGEIDSMRIAPTHRVKCALLMACAICSFIFVDSAAAQFHIPGLPGSKKDKNQTQPQSAPDPSQMPQMPPQAQPRQKKDADRDKAAVNPPGVPVPEDSPIFMAFKQLEKQPAYRMAFIMETNDPRMAQMAASGMGMGAMETIVMGGTKMVSMHMKMPATDVPSTIDDWEFRTVVRNGRAARLITSPAVPRLLKLGDAQLQMQMMMQDKMAAQATARAYAQGPIGAITAANIGAQTIVGNVEAARLSRKAHDFYSWQCLPGGSGEQSGGERKNTLTDMRLIGDQPVGNRSATAYEFYVRDGDKFHGPIHLLVAKDNGMPLRIELPDPQGQNSMHLDYSFDQIPEIEVPACLASAQ
jgi:hypothetical protein